MSDWMKSFQSIGRGFRPGMEINYATDGKIILDLESDDFRPWRETMRPHYAEYIDFDTGEKYWKKFNRQPKIRYMYTARNVVRHNEDGSYEYVKNRHTGELRKLTNEEVMWLLLNAGG